MRFIIYFLLIVALPSNVFAHWGHVGELAGHGHLIVVGAGVMAAGLAALLGKKSNDEIASESDFEDSSDGEIDAELEGAVA